MNRQQGMTLVELLVSLTIVLIVLGTASMAYLKLLKGYKSQGKIAQNYMANLTGLEMLRYDVEMAGFGLPSDMDGKTYSEAASGACSYDTGSALNDAPGGVPRPFATRDNSGPNGSDVLTIKSSVANINPTSRKSSMVTYGTPPTVKQWGVASADSVLDFADGDKLVMLSKEGKLMVNGGGTTWTPATFTGTDAFSLVSGLGMSARDVYFLYGLDSGSIHRMPFNRVDYYLDKVAGQFPSSCAESTYTLYRAVIDQTNGRPIAVPLLDCVHEFQVAFGLDTDSIPSVDKWVKDLGTMAAADMRKVREVRIFIVVQEGIGDIGKNAVFRFSGILNLGDQEIANYVDSANYPSNTFLTWSQTALPGTASLKSWAPTGADVQYRWKVLQLAVKPLNLK